MTTPRRIIGLGVLIGLVGAVGQIVTLTRMDPVAAAPLRGLISLCITVLIGVIAGVGGKTAGVKVAALMGFVAGTILSIVNLATILMNPTLAGQGPLASVEAFLGFVGGVAMGTAFAAWITVAVAVLVAWPISLALTQEGQK